MPRIKGWVRFNEEKNTEEQPELVRDLDKDIVADFELRYLRAAEQLSRKTLTTKEEKRLREEVRGMEVTIANAKIKEAFPEDNIEPRGEHTHDEQQ